MCIRDSLYMGSSCNSTSWINHRRQCTGSGPGEYKPDTNQYDQCSRYSNIYSYATIRGLYGSNLYSYSNSQPGSINKQYGIHYLQCQCIYICTGQWSKWHSTCRNNLYMGSTGNSTCWINHRRECTGSGPGNHKPDTDQYDQCRRNSNVYSCTIIRRLYGSNIYSYCNSQPGSINKQYGIHYLQCQCIYICTGQWSQWNSTCRNNLYMDSTGNSTSWINHRRQCTGSGPGEYKPDTDQYDQCRRNSNVYSCTIIGRLYGSNLYSYSNSQPCSINKQYGIPICSANAFTAAPANGVNGIVPAGTTYTWGAPVIAPVGSITGGSAQAVAQATISQTLTNTTNVVGTATYTVAPLSGGCTGATFTVTVTVNPVASINNMVSTICSANAFTSAPANGVNGTVPAGTTYTWTAPVIAPVGSITGGSAQGTGQASISQTLTNTTAALATATYTVTPLSGACSGATFTVTVTVNPIPTPVISGSTSVCANNVG